MCSAAGRLLAIAFLATAACVPHTAEAAPDEIVPCAAPPGPFDFYPPSGFSANDEALVRLAVDKWNAATNPDHQIRFNETSSRRILFWPPADPGLTGQYSRLGVVFIRPGVIYVHELSLHEIGHSLGLDHVPFPGSVMCGSPERDPALAVPNIDCGPAPGPDHFSGHDLDEARRVGAR